ncbi:hypothetical protein K523DRAFT_422270 [Schizophyllum commune Tattone D]|nr:hypothetical protein K523DRAFT_422270 [Schizophyllum commune Tattone D]
MDSSHSAKRLKLGDTGGHRYDRRPSVRSLFAFGRPGICPPALRRHAPRYVSILAGVANASEDLPHKPPHNASNLNPDIDIRDGITNTAHTSKNPSSDDAAATRASTHRTILCRFGPRMDPRILNRRQKPRIQRSPALSGGNRPEPARAEVPDRQPRPPTQNIEDVDEEDFHPGRLVNVQRRRLPRDPSRSPAAGTLHKDQDPPRNELDEFEAAFQQIDQEPSESDDEHAMYANEGDPDADTQPPVVGPSKLKTTVKVTPSGRKKKVKSPEELDFRMNVRAVTTHLLGISQGEYPTDDHTPSEEIIETFERTEDPADGPRGQPDFLIDIARDKVKNDWNTACVGIIYDELKTLDKKSLPPLEDVSETFFTFLRYLRTKYLQQRDGKGPSREHSNTLLRMHKIFDRRRQGWKLHLHIPGVKDHYKTWKKLSYRIVSPDRPKFSTDDQAGTRYKESKDIVYSAQTPIWRNPAEEPWIRIGSYLQIAAHFRDGKGTRGNLPAKRVRNYYEVNYDMKAPPRLPVNFYNPIWLTESRRKELKVRPAFDTTLPLALIREAARYEHVASRDAPPLGQDDPAIEHSVLFSQLGPERIRGPPYSQPAPAPASTSARRIR